jgi:hypothetical protein
MTSSSPQLKAGILGVTSFLMAGLLGAVGCGDAKNTLRPGEVNAEVTSVIVVGTSVTNKIYENGQYGITLVPKDATGQAVLGAGLKVGITINTPPTFTSQVTMSECTQTQAPGGAGLAVGVIIDDSGSMSGSDPTLKRKDATVAFIDTIGAGDEVLLTDYGPFGNNLRNLVCVQAAAPATGGFAPASANAACAATMSNAFTSDKAVLKAATAQIRASGGTPLYESCVQMVPLVAAKAGKRQAILLLSDGAPNASPMEAKCTADAIAAGIPIFTVGLGPAAEKPNGGGSQPNAVKVLRELSSATGGVYASADLPEQLMALFSNVGTALSQGKCGSLAILNEYLQLLPGTSVVGTVTVGDNNATGTFQFVAPPK